MSALITDGDERSALAVTRALGNKKIPMIVCAESERSLAAASKYCSQSFAYPSPYADPDGFVEQLLGYIKRYEIDVTFPMSDIVMELVGRRRKDFEKHTALPIPPMEVYECLSDKYKVMELATALRVPIPETIFVQTGCIEKALRRITQFPVVIKPARSVIHVKGCWKKAGVHYANSITELYRLYRTLDYLQQPTLIQRRIDGEGQGVFALMNHGEPIALFAHRRLREKPPSGGVSVLRESIGLLEPMTEYAVRLLKHVKWHGVAMVEFKVDRQSGLPLLMEVNGRFWGSLQLAIDAGVNFPWMLYQLAIGRPVERTVNGYRVGVKSRWLLGDLDHLLLRLFRQDEELHLAPDSPSTFQTLLRFCKFFGRDLHYEILSLSDPKPFRYELQQYMGGLWASLRKSR